MNTYVMMNKFKKKNFLRLTIGCTVNFLKMQFQYVVLQALLRIERAHNVNNFNMHSYKIVHAILYGYIMLIF